jgi:hypothetical protein
MSACPQSQIDVFMLIDHPARPDSAPVSVVGHSFLSNYLSRHPLGCNSRARRHSAANSSLPKASVLAPPQKARSPKKFALVGCPRLLLRSPRLGSGPLSLLLVPGRARQKGTKTMTDNNTITSFFSGSFRMVHSARMTIAAILATAILAAVPAHALSVKDFEAKPTKEQSAIIVAFVDKMTGDLDRDNPQLAQNIHDYFFTKQAGKPFAEGLENLSLELALLDTVAKHGKIDLSKIQIEGVILKVVKDKFPPQK